MPESAPGQNPPSFGVIACSDANMLPAACCALLSVHENLAAVGVRLFLLAIDLSEAQVAEVESFGRLHAMTIEILPYKTAEYDRESFGRWSRATLARLYLDRHVPRDIQRLLYVDADTIAVALLDDLFRIDMQGKALAAVDDYLMAFPEKIGRRQQKIGTRQGGRYFNAGVLLFDWQQCLDRDLVGRAREAFEKEPNRFDAHDQDVLNIAFEDNWLALPPRWNAQTGILPFVGKPAIVHFTGRKKPWQDIPPWPHRAMKDYYQRALQGSAWERFSRRPTVLAWTKSFLSHFSGHVTMPSKIASARRHFGRQ